MANKKLQSSPRNPRGRTSKVPLTYYRSAESGDSGSSPFENKRANKTRFHKFISRVFDGVLVLGVILLLCYSLIIKSHPKLNIDSNAYHSRDVYASAIINELDNVKNRNKITIDENEIINNLYKQFPELSNASIELPIFSQTPKINLDISEPSFLFNSNNTTYVIDSKGSAVGQASRYPSVKNLPLINDQTGFQAAPGNRILSADGVEFINAVLIQAKHANIPVSTLTLPALAQELDLRTQDKPYYVKFYLGGNAQQQIGQFLSTRKQLEQTHKEPAQYLDVRVNGKIFYK